MKNSKNAVSCDFLFLYNSVRHRVDRVLGFFSSRPSWDSPPPHPQASVPLNWVQVGGGGGTQSIATEGLASQNCVLGKYSLDSKLYI